MAKKTPAQVEAQKKYMGKFAVARVRMDKDHYERVKNHAESRGESVSGFFVRAADETIERDEKQ